MLRWIALLSILLPPVTARSARPEVFRIEDGLAENLLVRVPEGSAQVVRYKEKPRVIVAFPGGNSGALIDLGPGGAPVDAVKIDDLRQTGDRGHMLRLRLSLTQREVIRPLILPGSVREIRNYLRRGGSTEEHWMLEQYRGAFERLPEALREKLAREGFHPDRADRGTAVSWKVADAGRTLIASRDEYLGPRKYQVVLKLSDCDALPGPLRGWRCPDAAEIDVSVFTPYRPLIPIPDEELLHAAARAELADPAWLARLGEDERLLLERARQALRFLAVGDKLMAGGWRFLTYFGRDTLFSTRMLLPVAGPALLEAAIGSVLERLSPEGRVAHEENLGNQAILDHMAAFVRLVDAGRPDAAAAEIRGYAEAVMDYKMVDDDFLLVPLVRDILSVPKERLSDDGKARLLRGDRAARLAINMEWMLAQTERGLEDGKGIRIEDRWVGNWRDSNEGLGLAPYPGDVNRFLVPIGLRALGDILADPLAERVGLLCAIREAARTPRLKRALHEAGYLDGLLERWRAIAEQYRVRIGPKDLRQRVAAFLEGSKARTYFEGLELEPGCAMRGYASGACTPAALLDGLTFTALSLRQDGTQVDVLNSDPVFALFDQRLGRDNLIEHLAPFTLPYPVGLQTAAGPLVANAVVGSSDELRGIFGPEAYHGAVIWGWMAGKLVLAIEHQRHLGSNVPGSPEDKLLEAATLLFDKERRRLASVATSELWTWEIREGNLVPVPFGSAAGHTSEANAAQLWNTVWLPVYLHLKDSGSRTRQ